MSLNMLSCQKKLKLFLTEKVRFKGKSKHLFRRLKEKILYRLIKLVLIHKKICLAWLGLIYFFKFSKHQNEKIEIIIIIIMIIIIIIIKMK